MKQFQIITHDKTRVWLRLFDFEVFIGTWQGIQKQAKRGNVLMRFRIGAIILNPILVNKYVVLAKVVK